MGNGNIKQNKEIEKKEEKDLKEEKEKEKEDEIQSRKLRLKIVESIPLEFNKLTVILLVNYFLSNSLTYFQTF